MYGTILCPTDGSEAAASAFDHGLTVAERFGATVHALYVVDLESASYGFRSEEIDRLRDGDFEGFPEAERRATEATGRIARLAAERGVDVVEAVEIGNPPKRIVSYAAENDVDLVVMASRGHSGLRRALLGSVTDRVVRTADLPVLVVDTRDEPAE